MASSYTLSLRPCRMPFNGLLEEVGDDGGAEYEDAHTKFDDAQSEVM